MEHSDISPISDTNCVNFYDGEVGIEEVKIKIEIEENDTFNTSDEISCSPIKDDVQIKTENGVMNKDEAKKTLVKKGNVKLMLNPKINGHNSPGCESSSSSCTSEDEIDVVSVDTTQLPFAAAATHVTADLLRTPTSQDRHHMVTMDMTPQRPITRKRLEPPPSIVSLKGSRRRARGSGRRKRSVPPSSIVSLKGSRRRARGSNRHGCSDTDIDSEAESPELERRSIHNDMERKRRIDLRNLFDKLKKQISAAGDKNRTPKIVILREAAALCRKLSQGDIEREKLRKKHNQLMARLKKLRRAAGLFEW